MFLHGLSHEKLACVTNLLGTVLYVRRLYISLVPQMMSTPGLSVTNITIEKAEIKDLKGTIYDKSSISRRER
jgi:hypothetical protein